MTTTPAPLSPGVRPTGAFQAQAAISFVVSLVGTSLGIAYLPVGGWIRAFLALGLLYVVTSCFTLAKTLRDAQETSTVLSRVDQARLDQLLSAYDPFKV